MKFLVDNQIPPALARFISEDLRVEALHVMDVGLRNGTDADVWAYASENDFVLIFERRRLRDVVLKDPFGQVLVEYQGGWADAFMVLRLG